MKPGGGGAKGASFEREICVKLSEWISGGTSKDLLWRSAMSGGRATVMKRKGQTVGNQLGDISAVGEEGHRLTSRFVVECKCVASLDLVPFLYRKPRGRLYAFWQKLTSEVAGTGKQPMLIARQNRYPTLLVVDSGFYAGAFDGLFTTSLLPLFEASHFGVVFWNLDDFLQQTNFEGGEST